MPKGSLKCYRLAGFLEEPVLPGEEIRWTTKCTWDSPGWIADALARKFQ
jgi:hypothetical protein